MTPATRTALQTVLGTAGSLGLLAMAGWIAADPQSEEPSHVFTLAPIMATRSTGSGRPVHAERRARVVQASPLTPASLAR